MDEIIIVDTGSTDRTKEIAAKYTDKIYDYGWTGNFSDARNFSFSKATMEYIYCADADEILDQENIQKFSMLKSGLLPDIEIVQMYYCNQLSFNTIYNYDKELRPKLYKRLRQFKWINPIHESVRLDPVVYDSDIEIIHKPDCLHASRDLSAFRKMYHDNMHFSKKLHNLYAKELFIAGEDDDFIDAADFFAQSVADPERSSEEVMEASCVLAHAYRISNDTVSFYKYTVKNVAGEGCSEICYELGCFYEEMNDYDEAVIWFYNAAFETLPILNLHYGGDYPLAKLAECYQALGMTDMAHDYAKQTKEWLEQN
jgi:glycosyltransferase involved in cell wall biosynthesis